MDPIAGIYLGKPAGDTDPQPEATTHALVVEPDPNAVRATSSSKLAFVPGQGLQTKSPVPPAS